MFSISFAVKIHRKKLVNFWRVTRGDLHIECLLQDGRCDLDRVSRASSCGLCCPFLCRLPVAEETEEPHPRKQFMMESHKEALSTELVNSSAIYGKSMGCCLRLSCEMSPLEKLFQHQEKYLVYPRRQRPLIS